MSKKTKQKERRRARVSSPSPAVPRLAKLTDRERGLQAFERKDYDTAIAAWTVALRTTSAVTLAQALAEAYFRRALLNAQRTPIQALEDLKAATDLSPENPLYLYHRGLAYHRQEHFPEAIASYRESIRYDPLGYGRTAYSLCLAIAESGSDPSADAVWELLTSAQRDRLIPNDPAYSEALTHLASKNVDAAEPALLQLLNTRRGFAHYYLGVIAQRHSDTDEALAHWLCAHSAGFNTAALRHNLVTAYIARTNTQANSPELLETVRAGLRLSPESPILLALRQRAEFLFGNKAAEAGDWREALVHWQTARRSNSSQVARIPRELLANIALAHEKLGQWSEAAATWRELIRRRPRRGENAWSAQHVVQLWRHIELLYARDGEYSQSALILRYAIKAQPDDLTLRLALVKRQMENENWRSAEAAVLRILEMSPTHPEANALYAQILDIGEDLDLMIAGWEKVAGTRDPRQVHAAQQRLSKLYPERAEFYLSVDDPDSAAADYTKALQLSPTDAVLRARFGLSLIADKPDLARAQFEQVDLTNDAVAVIVICGWHRAKQSAEAINWLNRTAAAKPLSAALLVELGTEIFSSDIKAANAYFERAVAQTAHSNGKHDGSRLLTIIAVVYAAHGRSSDAYEYARQALKLDAQFGPAHLNLGLWDAARGRRPASQDHLQKALAWARRNRYSSITDGIEEAINLIAERYIPTLDEILDTIDPNGSDETMRRLMGSLPKRGKL